MVSLGSFDLRQRQWFAIHPQSPVLKLTSDALQPAFQAINLEPEENVDEQIDTTKELHVWYPDTTRTVIIL